MTALLAPMIWSATLSLGGASGAPGTTVSLPVSLSSAGSVISAVQWTVTYSTSDFSSLVLQAGTADGGAGKNLDCSELTAGQATCIVSGVNQSSIPDGVIATALLTIAPTSTNTSSDVTLSNVSLADPNANPVAATATGSTVNIVQPGTTLAGLACSPSSITAPASTSCTVTLAGNAPSGGASIGLTYASATATISGPATVTVPSGEIQAAFPLQALGATGPGAVMITASLSGTGATFSLDVAPDTTPPTAPANLTALAAPGQEIDLSWTASTDNVAVTQYLVERCEGHLCSNFIQIATTATTSYADTGLAPRTWYSYRVRAADAAGNLSTYSIAASARTQR